MKMTRLLLLTDRILQTATQNETKLVCANNTLKDLPIIYGSVQCCNWKISYHKLRIPLETTAKLLKFWAGILTHGSSLRKKNSA